MLTILMIVDYNVLYISFNHVSDKLNLLDVSFWQHFPWKSKWLHALRHIAHNRSFWNKSIIDGNVYEFVSQQYWATKTISWSVNEHIPIDGFWRYKRQWINSLISAGLLGIKKSVIAQDVMLTRAVTYGVLVSPLILEAFYSWRGKS